MSLIKPKITIEYVTKKIKLPKDLSEKIENYCEWAEIQEFDHFIAEAAKDILKRDKDYVKFVK